MKLKRILLISIITCISVTLIAVTYSDTKKKEQVVISTIYEILKNFHYSPKDLNDTFSEQVFDLYIQSLDYSKMYFTKKEIDILSTYKTSIDDNIRQGNLDFFDLSIELLNKQFDKLALLYPSYLAEPLNYDVQESIEIDEKKHDFMQDQFELETYWKKYLKLQVLDEIIIMENEQYKQLLKSDTATQRNFKEIEKDARDKILKRYNTRFKRLKQTTRADRFSSFVNAITAAFDPHTNYFPPKEKQDFDISMSGKLQGIGATLSEKDGFIKVVEIMPGSPSWKQGELKKDDIILKVAQGDAEAVDIVDMRLDEAVQLIRGPKGTKVVLTVKKVDGKIITIPIIRDVIELEEKYAKSAIISLPDQTGPKIGYIYLPQFYTDMNDASGRKCSEDIKKELQILQSEKVQGIIIDLRDNGGGSLNDVVDIGGYFIEKGPIVQVNSTGNNRRVYYDNDASIVYNGPLIIIVNSFSASASEILAAAMQDYKRAIIVGTKSTYGKGTVQRFVDIDRLLENQYKEYQPLGAVKVTIQKFYRINGGSTQLKGVTPDIILPDMYETIEIGEKELDYAMQWDETIMEPYELWKTNYDVKKIAKKSEIRTKSDTAFIKISESAVWLNNKRNDTNINLEINNYRVKQKQNIAETEKYKNVGKSTTPLEIINFSNQQKQSDKELDSLLIKKTQDWHNELKKDIELFETYRIISDMINENKR